MPRPTRGAASGLEEGPHTMADEKVRPTSDEQHAALMGGSLPEPEEIRQGIHAVALDMPGMQPPYALVYALLGKGRDVHLIDSGLNTDANWEALTTALQSIGREISDIASITLTHLHFDHTGLANRIREASGAIVRMHVSEAAAIRGGMQFSAGYRVADKLAEWGVPAEWGEQFLALAEKRGDTATAVTVDEELADGAVIDFGTYSGTVIHTPGHTTGHLCVAIEHEDIVFTGDHVLPLINPGVGLGGESHADPLGEYYASLEKLAPYSEAEVLPGHGFRFAPLGARIAEIRAHHEARTRQAATELVADSTLTVWQVASKLKWTGGWEGLPLVSRVSALSQTAMHLARIAEETRHG